MMTMLEEYDIIRYIYEEFDYETYLHDNFTVKETFSNSKELRVCCPACTDTRYRLYVNNDKKVFHCFNCPFSSKRYDVFDLVAATERLTRKQAIHKLISEYRKTVPEDLEEFLTEKTEREMLKRLTKKQPIRVISGLPKGLAPLETHSEDNKECWDYLYSRGLTEQEIVAMKTHYCPKGQVIKYPNGNRSDVLFNRVVWPIYGGNHSLVSWIARTTDPKIKRRKYINCPGSDLAKTVWPYVPLGKKTRSAVIVEGILDCMALRRAGYAGYATFGKKLSSYQLELLVNWGVESLFIFYDPEAQAAIQTTVEDVKASFNNVYVVDCKALDSDEDPGDLLRKEDGSEIVKEAINDAINVKDVNYLRWCLR